MPHIALIVYAGLSPGGIRGLDLVLINDPKRKVTDEGVLARTTWVALDRETAIKSETGPLCQIKSSSLNKEG